VSKPSRQRARVFGTTNFIAKLQATALQGWFAFGDLGTLLRSEKDGFRSVTPQTASIQRRREARVVAPYSGPAVLEIAGAWAWRSPYRWQRGGGGNRCQRRLRLQVARESRDSDNEWTITRRRLINGVFNGGRHSAGPERTQLAMCRAGPAAASTSDRCRSRPMIGSEFEPAISAAFADFPSCAACRWSAPALHADARIAWLRFAASNRTTLPAGRTKPLVTATDRAGNRTNNRFPFLLAALEMALCAEARTLSPGSTSWESDSLAAQRAKEARDRELRQDKGNEANTMPRTALRRSHRRLLAR